MQYMVRITAKGMEVFVESRFSDVFVQTKNKLRRSIYHAEFSKCANFH